ncbi:GTPase [Candidatus Woesearchaeota archaeon CG10_big_fil_rev_8_21_14_0_10_34_8]|nr:MAG: GTPase [Candidatus Woesearchaeota archaeon CG10_big_fil_rev_8_21_14_0_10_34_8]
MPIKIIIMGAAGRDFHNFNVLYRNNPKYKVAAFTAAQIPGIAGRRYPAKLAGRLYKKGIPIYDEKKLVSLIKKHKVNGVVFSYSDVSYRELKQKEKLVKKAGADFVLVPPKKTMLKSRKKVISVCATRTGAGKSQTTRYVCDILKSLKKKFVVIRHPMPYGDLIKQEVMRFAKFTDMKDCTIEECEEFEPHLKQGNIVYCGVDYEKILKKAEKEASVIVWDGGNNDTPFYSPDLHIVVADPLRAGDEIKYYPSDANVALADVVVINKENSSTKRNISIVEKNVLGLNSKVKIVHANSPIEVDEPAVIAGKKVIVVEDGPTLTHGGMKYGAGYVAAKKYKCKIVPAFRYAVGSIKDTYKKYKQIRKMLPAMGYGKKQIMELQRIINNANADAVIVATPVDITRFMKLNKPTVKVSYSLEEKGNRLEKIIRKKFK